VDDNEYWSGSAWITPETWLSVDGSTSWSFDSSSVTWVDGKQYLIKSRARDNISNIEIPTSGTAFFIDKSKPLSVINFPIESSYLNNLENISGSFFTDIGSDINTVEISIIRVSDDYYWNGTEWSDTETWLNCIINQSADEWYFNSSSIDWTTDTWFSLGSRATDLTNNVEIPTSIKKFMYDDQAPKSSSSDYYQ